MAFINAGLGAQLMMKQETTPGTAVAPDHSYDFESESVEAKKKEVIAKTLRAGNMVDRGAGRFVTQRYAAGDINMIFPNKSAGLILQNMMGSFGATPAQLGATTAYQQVHTPGSTQGKTLSVQIGKPALTGSAAEPYTYTGAKFTDWELNFAQSDLLKLKLTLDAFDELTSVTSPASPALGAWTPPTYSYFNFMQGSLLVGGTVSTVSMATPTQSASTAGTGGSLTSGTYYTKVAGINGTGETAASNEVSVAVASSGTLTVNWTAVTNATQIKIYVSNTGSGNEAVYTVAAGSATTLTITTMPVTAGTPLTTATATGVTSITGGTAAAAVLGGKIGCKNGLKIDNYYLGNGTTKAEQNQNNWREYTGSFDLLFQSRAAWYDAYRADTPQALELKFVGPQIGSSGYFFTLDVLMSQIYLEDGVSPKTAGPDVLKQTAPFKVFNDDVNNPFQVTYTTSDTTI